MEHCETALLTKCSLAASLSGTHDNLKLGGVTWHSRNRGRRITVKSQADLGYVESFRLTWTPGFHSQTLSQKLKLKFGSSVSKFFFFFVKKNQLFFFYQKGNLFYVDRFLQINFLQEEIQVIPCFLSNFSESQTRNKL